MAVAETYEHKGIDVEIHWDDDLIVNPRKEWDHLGTMVCWHRRYDLGDERAPEGFDSIPALIASYEPRVVLPLGLLDHSGLTMWVGSGPHWSDAAGWDSGQVGFIFVTAERIREEYGCKRITKAVEEKVEAALRSEVKEYDSYLRGECYGYVVAKDTPEVDSCWGFLGDVEYCKEAANEAAEYAATERARRLATERMYLLDPEANPYALAA